MANVYLFTEGLDSSDQTKDQVAEWLCKKVGVSSECMQVGDWRMPKSMGIVSGIVLVMPDHLQAAVFRLGKPVEGTSNVKNAEISIDNEDVNSLLLAPQTTKVYVGGSVAVLKDALNKGGQGVQGGSERRSPEPGLAAGRAPPRLRAFASSCRRAWRRRRRHRRKT